MRNPALTDNLIWTGQRTRLAHSGDYASLRSPPMRSRPGCKSGIRVSALNGPLHVYLAIARSRFHKLQARRSSSIKSGVSGPVYLYQMNARYIYQIALIDKGFSNLLGD